MRVSRMLRATTAGILASGIVAASATSAFAEMSDPPACEQDANGGCLGGPGGMNGGAYIGTEASRTFLTDNDVPFILSTMMQTHYVAAEWDSWGDFERAMNTYWNLNAPANRTCSIAEYGSRTSYTNPCNTVSFNYYPNGDGSVDVTMMPKL